MLLELNGYFKIMAGLVNLESMRTLKLLSSKKKHSREKYELYQI